jgi:hypothetical protein
MTYEVVICDPNTASANRTVRTVGPSVTDVTCITSTGVAGHPATVAIDPVVYQQMPADVALDSSEVAAVWTAAFGLVVSCYFIGRAVGAVLDMLKKG